MSPTNPFAKPRPTSVTATIDAEPTTPSRPEPPKRQFSGFKQHLQSLQREGKVVSCSPRSRESVGDEDWPSDAAADTTAGGVIFPQMQHTKTSTPIHAPTVSSHTPTSQRHTPSAATTLTPRASSSKWRLLWRGGLQVGEERYTLPGIAFCARILIPPTSAVAVAIPLSPVPLSPTPTPLMTIGTGGQSTQGLDIEGKELAMREEGSYFPSSAADAATATATTSTSTSTFNVPQTISSAETDRHKTLQGTQHRLRPLLHPQSTSAITSHSHSDNATTRIPGAASINDTQHKAFTTTPSGPTGGDTDLCLSLESMKGRKTLRVRSVERLQDDDLDVPDEEDSGAVHTPGLLQRATKWSYNGEHGELIGFWRENRYLDPSSQKAGPSLLAQYIFNTLCRAPLSSSGRTRKALVVTLGDDVIDAQAGTFLIYGQLKSHFSNEDTGAERPKLELLATRRRRSKVVAAPERATGVVMRPGEPLPRGYDASYWRLDTRVSGVLFSREAHRVGLCDACTFPLGAAAVPGTVSEHRPWLTHLFVCATTDTLYTNDVVGGFKVPTIPSSRGLRRTASVAAQAARMSRAKSSGRIYMPPPAAASTRAGSSVAMSPSNSASSPTADGVVSTSTTMTVTKKLTPGRRGEKRKRPTEQQVAQDDDRRRRAGKITAIGNGSLIVDTDPTLDTSRPSEIGTRAESAAPIDDDPFGHGGRIQDSTTAIIRPALASRSHATQEWEGKNKASIKKRLLACLEARQCGRDHPEFKDVFSIANRGVCFALRNTIAAEPLDKDSIDRIVQVHLDLYLPMQGVNSSDDTLAKAIVPSIPATNTPPTPVVLDNRNDPDTTII
ncbi:hypothetical protein QFC21_001301 [Naganishia friedmannii]|uniref:Uncharacterized protein n=1 Tax=Naganishia friedmannii TaxID=89922 RepID=A0ACC2W423_9TREE|nr:hypothetical protein QFC21_001301 [Naganishia friedmannii]